MSLNRELSMQRRKNRFVNNLDPINGAQPRPYTVSWGILQSTGGNFKGLFFDKSVCSSPLRAGSFASQSSSDTTRSRRFQASQSRYITTRSLVKFLQSVGSLREFPYPTSLRDHLLENRIEWPENSDRFFLPCDVLKHAVTSSSIYVELGHHNTEMEEGDRLMTTISIRSSAVKLFALLVSLGKGQLIYNFLDENIGDKDLPFQRSDEANKSGTYKFCSKLNVPIPLKCMVDWDSRSVVEFSRMQCSMDPPVFEYCHHYEIDDSCVLPFLNSEGSSDEVKEGGFSTVWKAKIYPAHHRFRDKTRKNFDNTFALKRLHSDSREDFDTEVVVLKAMNNRSHPHLVKLLCTFRYKREYYLLFPYAKSNLRQYWEENPRPNLSHDALRWMLKQCKSITSALHRIHECRSTHESDSQPNIGEDDRVYGRHGDIKAENILLSLDEERKYQHSTDPGILLIADFGLTDLHRRITRSLILSENINGTPTYEPPEKNSRGLITRKYDIWSLGCVFLEFLIWRVWGWEQLNRFHQVRTTDGSKDRKYYTITRPERGVSQSEPVVRACVQEWIQNLRESQRHSGFLLDFVGLISYGMLVVDESKRISCAELNVALSEMVDKAETNLAYLTRRHQARAPK